jgi:transitional endoplasmic reticulum ATPase
MVMTLSPRHATWVEPDFPVQWPLTVAVVTWMAVAVGGAWGLPIGTTPPYVGLTVFRIGLAIVCLLATAYPFALLVLAVLGQSIPSVLKRPFQVMAWSTPSVLSMYLAGLSSLTGGFLIKTGLFLVWLAIVLVLPMVLFVAAGLAVFCAMQVIRPLWWICGCPQQAFFGAAAPAVEPSAKGELPKAGAPVASQSLPQAYSAEPIRTVAQQPAYEFEWRMPHSRFADLAGMEELKAELNAAIRPFMGYRRGEAVADRNGILLSGPPGNGKTAFAMAIAGELGLPFVKVSGVDIASKWVNESGAVLKSLFQQAAQQPCVVFLDEFDSLAKDRSSSHLSEEDRKLVTALLTLIDESRRQRIVLVAATNYLDLLDKAVVREGRFDYRIEVMHPDLPARIGILTGLLVRFKLQASAQTLDKVARLWERRSIAFMESTVKRLRDDAVGQSGPLPLEAFKLAARAASRRAGNIPSTGARLSELVVPESVRRETASLLYRLRNWESLAELGGQPPSGVLLYGPPGTGKTNLVRALARELEDWHVFEVNATDVLLDPRKFTEIAELAAVHRPAFVFIDEADELLRDRAQSSSTAATNQILKTMDGLMGQVPEVVFIAATNLPEVIDSAALRGGRFAEHIYMGRLSGSDLEAFLQKEFARRTQVRFGADLTPQSLARCLGEASAAVALAVLNKAINASFGSGLANHRVCMVEIEATIQASSRVSGSTGCQDWSRLEGRRVL